MTIKVFKIRYFSFPFKSNKKKNLSLKNMVCREVYLKMFAGGDSIFNREVAGNTSERWG